MIVISLLVKCRMTLRSSSFDLQLEIDATEPRDQAGEIFDLPTISRQSIGWHCGLNLVIGRANQSRISRSLTR